MQGKKREMKSETAFINFISTMLTNNFRLSLEKMNGLSSSFFFFFFFQLCVINYPIMLCKFCFIVHIYDFVSSSILFLALSAVLGKVRDFLGIISEANEKLQLDAKVGILILPLKLELLVQLSTFFMKYDLKLDPILYIGEFWKL